MRTTPRLVENGDDLLRAIEGPRTAVSEVGAHRIEVVTITRNRMCLHPSHLPDGEAIARSLGLDLPMDHRMFVPGHTLWCGEREGLETQVRSILRQVEGVAR
ncbi:hypothetical protein APR04_001656 [Promicromonospora umidemergens]|uniref:Uncharacterized protein n=1 Tax=Promicromonospora umidemergens TaxID=629679 RepID=A0ABP8Y2H9_9MICO|nr:hypothetical protein [Promicromonospora umidemergens]MCP2282758.1 hypothetical protein [Promicromonospora umidemergens]